MVSLQDVLAPDGPHGLLRFPKSESAILFYFSNSSRGYNRPGYDVKGSHSHRCECLPHDHLCM